jgi:hypothetical protein
MEMKKEYPTPAYDEEVLASFPEIEPIEFQKQHSVLEKVEITEKIKKSTEYNLNNQEIKNKDLLEQGVEEFFGGEIFCLISRSRGQPEDLMFDEIPQPSQMELTQLSISQPLFVKKLELRRDMFCEYDGWVFKTRLKSKEVVGWFMVFHYLIENGVNIVVYKRRWSWKYRRKLG